MAAQGVGPLENFLLTPMIVTLIFHQVTLFKSKFHLGSEYLTAVHLIQLKLTAFNLTATDTNLQARRTFNFLAMNESIN